MANFVRVSVDLSAVGRKTNAVKKVIREESLKMAEEVAQFGELEMKSNIAASGTAFSQAARQAGINRGPGRYRTGTMYNAVKSRVESGQKQVRAAFGWISKFEDYFRYQELGFRNRFIASYTPSGQLITDGGRPLVRFNPYGGYKNTKGMFALRDARLTVQQELPRFSKKYEGIISRRLKALKR